jgi:hypothetical protein
MSYEEEDTCRRVMVTCNRLSLVFGRCVCVCVCTPGCLCRCGCVCCVCARTPACLSSVVCVCVVCVVCVCTPGGLGFRALSSGLGPRNIIYK